MNGNYRMEEDGGFDEMEVSLEMAVSGDEQTTRSVTEGDWKASMGKMLSCLRKGGRAFRVQVGYVIVPNSIALFCLLLNGL